eukprot:symbB.v1.2.008184.t1/scaffold450.1/size202773/3
MFEFAREVVSIVRLSGSLLGSLQLDGDATLELAFRKVPKEEGPFMLVSADGRVVQPSTRVSEIAEGNHEVILTVIAHPVQEVSSTRTAFALITSSGSVVAWGDADMGGDTKGAQKDLMTNVLRIYSNAFAFAALKRDGSVISWGLPTGGGDSRSVRSSLACGVKEIFATRLAFAALKEDGSVVCWGAATYGGDSPVLSQRIRTIRSTDSAFAALKEDGSIIAWGDATGGGDASSVQDELQDVTELYACKYAFAAVTCKGFCVVCWGNAISTGSVKYTLDVPVRCIYSTSSAFAALDTAGDVRCWGDCSSGGELDEQPQEVTHIFGNEVAFAALKKDGSVVTWGGHYLDLDLKSGPSQTLDQLSNGICYVTSTCLAFAALKEDASVVTWGHRNRGGDSTEVSHRLANGVRQICATDNAFAAVTLSGAVVTWGVKDSGGDSSSVEMFLQSDVHQVFSTCNAFMAIKYDGSIVAWGGRRSGGDASMVSRQLQVADFGWEVLVVLRPWHIRGSSHRVPVLRSKPLSRMALAIHEPTGFSKSNLYDGLRSVVVAVGSSQEEVPLDPVRGPLVMQLDGTTTHLQTVRGITGGGQVAEKLWDQMTSTEQTCALHICAKKNRFIKEKLEELGSAPAKFLTVPGQ